MSFEFTQKAQALIDENHIEEAILWLRNHIREMPGDWKPAVEFDDSIDRFFWNQPEFLSFVKYYKSNLGKSVFWRTPSYSKAYYLLGFALVDRGRFREALDEIENGIVLEPDHPRLLCEKAFILGKLGDHQAALIYFQKAINSRPWNTIEQKTHALNEKATTLMNLDRLDEAEITVRETLLLKPDDKQLKEKLLFIKELKVPNVKKTITSQIPKRLLKEGQKLKKTYEVEKFLGEGGFAEVYRVKHNIFGRQALKIFKAPGSVNEINRSLEEAVLLSKLGHRGIVRVFDAGVYEDEGNVHGYFTMEHVAGGNLYQHWQNYGNKLIPVNETVDLVNQIAEALALAHQDTPPIVHRDIKPHNILIGYDALGMRACLSDFGLAKHVHPLQLAASVRGTLIYKAPETFYDSAADSCAGDVWALGIVLYQLLTNHFPYELNVNEQLNLKSFQSPLKSPQDFNILIDKELEKIVGKALAIEKSYRYQNAAEFLLDLRRWKANLANPAKQKKTLTSESNLMQNLSQDADQLIQQALSFAYEEGDIAQACELLAQALEIAPQLRNQYQSRLELWRSGKIM